MRIALQFERGASADNELFFENRPKRDNDLLPRQRTSRTAINAPRRLLQPAHRHVMASQGSRIAMFGQPGRIDYESLGQIMLQPV